MIPDKKQPQQVPMDRLEWQDVFIDTDMITV